MPSATAATCSAYFFIKHFFRKYYPYELLPLSWYSSVEVFFSNVSTTIKMAAPMILETA